MLLVGTLQIMCPGKRHGYIQATMRLFYDNRFLCHTTYVEVSQHRLNLSTRNHGGVKRD
jgi:hypothetical protein